MAVVIDEMQVDTQEPRQEQRGQSGGGASANGGSSQQPPKPEEVERAHRMMVERAERVWAY